MSTDPRPSMPSHHHSLVQGGSSYRLACRLGFEPPSPPGHFRKIVLLILVTWLPLVILSLAEGHAVGGRVALPLLYDPVVYTRFIFVVPLLELAQVVVAMSLAAQSRQFLNAGLVAEHDRPRFDAAQAQGIRLRASWTAEAVIVVLALTTSGLMRVLFAPGSLSSSWERTGSTITLAGWYYVLVSLPILIFFLLRWLWVLFLWAQFLFRVSRLPLELTPTHPDRAGGLGFLGWGLASFSTVLMAASAVLAGGFANEIVYRGTSLTSLKYHIIVFIASALAFLHAPLFVFFGQLARCRFRGLLEFGTLVAIHDRAFDEKWVKAPETNRAELLGSRDVASLAAIARVFEHVEHMQLIPFDKKALAVLIVAAILPLIPLLGTAIPLREIFSKLFELMV